MKKRERTAYGERIFTARKHAKLTQIELAKAVGMAQSTLGELEYVGNGSTYTAQIAKACGVRPDWLARGEGAMIDSGALSRDVADLAAQINALPQRQQEWVLGVLRQTIDAAQQTIGVNGQAAGSPEGVSETTSPKRRRAG
jgi:transcriptional regulator with XRE-family HTH domain